MQRDTQLIHHPYRPPEGFEAPQVPVYKASTVCFPDLASFRSRNMRSRSGYSYGLHGTPTVYTLEQRIATLEGARHCLLTPSGLSAITVVDYALLAAGDEVLLPDNVYAPSRDLARHELQRFGISHRLYDPLDADALAEMIGPATKLVWIEAPGSVTMEFPDIAGLTSAARAKGVLTAFDNTWGAGVAFDPFALGVDVSVHALTKYPSGGGDVLMGSVCTRDDALHERLLLTHARMGWGIAGNDAELVLRSLPSMVMRYRAQDQAGRDLARWMATRPEVSRVLHPALEGSPGHGYWKTSCRAAAGLFSVLFDERFAQPQVDRFVEALKLFRIGSSWAGPSSLVVPYDLQAMRGTAPYKGCLVRFSLGLEATEDLKADVAQALERLQG